jgi:outer membrane protein TolC
MKRIFLASLFLAGGAISIGADPSSTPPSYTLNDCLKIAIDHNQDMRTASEQFIAAKGTVMQLRSILYPTLDAQAYTTPFTFYVQFQQLIYTHATFPSIRLGRLTTDQAFINYRQTLVDTVFRVRQDFTNLLAARMQVDIVQKFADEKLNAVKVTQQLFDAGQVQKSVVANVQVQANLAQQAVANDKLAYTQAKLLLETDLGQKLPESAQFVGDFSVKLPENLDTGALINQALNDREDLKLLESQKLSEQQQILIDTENAYPFVGFSSNSTINPPELAFAKDFNAEANYNQPSTIAAAGQTQLPLSLYATWTIYDGGLARGIKKTDQAVVATTEVAISQMKASIPGEVGGAVSRIETQRKSLQAMDAQPKPEELRKLSEAAFQAGELRQLDKVNLENDILSQEVLHLTAQYQLCLAAAALDHALGHGLKIVQSSPSQSHP